MTKKICLITYVSIFILIFSGFLFSNDFSYASPNSSAAENPQLEKIKEIFKRNCIKCHSGIVPAQELNLEPGNLISSTVDVTSMQKMNLNIIDSSNPGKSYLLMKIKGEKNIVGKQMPLKKEPLSNEEIKTIEEWIMGLKDSQKVSDQQPKAKPGKNAFWGTRLINLATPTIIPKGHLLFRISHRFLPSVEDGYDSFFGFDGPAIIFFSMGYGISPNMDITIGRSNMFQEWELMLKWRILSPAKDSTFPLAVALHTGANLVTQESVSDSDKLKYNLQLTAAYPITPKISILLVPGYSSNVNHFNPSPEGTFALGTGIRLKLSRHLSIMGEWVPVLSGYKANTHGWGLGIEYKIGKHLFQVFILNSFGITTDQFMAGGDFSLNDGDFRFGFNIFREF